MLYILKWSLWNFLLIMHSYLATLNTTSPNFSPNTFKDTKILITRWKENLTHWQWRQMAYWASLGRHHIDFKASCHCSPWPHSVKQKLPRKSQRAINSLCHLHTPRGLTGLTLRRRPEWILWQEVRERSPEWRTVGRSRDKNRTLLRCQKQSQGGASSVHRAIGDQCILGRSWPHFSSFDLQIAISLMEIESRTKCIPSSNKY